MKNLFFCLLAAMSIMIIGCNDDPCEDLNCGTGICVDGTCDCPDGFSGVNCEIQDLCFGIDCGPGTCMDGTCDCPDGFSGDNCEIEDLCFNVDCGNGTCDPDTGDCNCDEGYEGANCELEERAKFIGTWNSDDFSCDGEPGEELTFFIEAAADILQVNLICPDMPGLLIVTDVNGNDLTIEPQMFNVGGIDITVSGSGSIDGDILTLNLIQELAGFGEVNCVGTFML